MPDPLIFQGAPSQVINLPALLKGALVMALILAIHACTAGHFGLHWRAIGLQMAAVMLATSLPFIKTARTHIVIDRERILWRQGIFTSRTSTLELGAIRAMACVYPRWQRRFGVGTILIKTDDAAHPMRRLPGMHDAEQLRAALSVAASARRDVAPDHAHAAHASALEAG